MPTAVSAGASSSKDAARDAEEGFKDDGMPEIGKAIAAMVDIVCPLIGTRFPDAARCRCEDA